MPRAQLISLETGEVLEDLGFYETAHQARSACGRHAEQLLIWELDAEEDLWTSESEDAAYQVEADPPE